MTKTQMYFAIFVLKISCALDEYQNNACSQFNGTQNMGRTTEQKQ